MIFYHYALSIACGSFKLLANIWVVENDLYMFLCDSNAKRVRTSRPLGVEKFANTDTGQMNNDVILW